nr:aspartyl-phosphate phosphatase Spo0E family protein [Lysinibacillus timonensis]
MDKVTLNLLEKKRELMIQSGLKNGLLNFKTIRLSKELDQLMNKYDSKFNDYQRGKIIN